MVKSRREANGGDYEDLVVQLGNLCMAQAMVAVEPLLRAAPDGSVRIRATAVAARRYVDSPSDEAWYDFCAAATSSYPFGPGDGCHAIEELGGHGAFGAVCFSGVGSLGSVAEMVGYDVVMHVLREQLPAVLPAT